MKPIKILLFAAVITVSVSCSVQRSLTRTAKVAHLKPELITMPTVVDFDVSDTPVTADTVVTRNMFKKEIGFQSKRDVTDALVASVLKSADADVLMEPKITAETESRGFTSTLRIALVGYPAKYAGFRTITMEDVDILNALKKEARTSTVSMSRFLRTDIGKLYGASSMYASVPEGLDKTVLAPEEKTHWRRKTGYKGIYEIGYNYTIDSYFDSDDVSFDATMYALISQGALLSPYFYLGGCTGFDVMSNRWDDFRIPLLAHMRVYLLNRRCSPYFDLKLGGAPVFYEGDYDGFSANVHAGLGLSIGAFSFGANYDIGMNVDYVWDGLKFNIAFSF